MKKVLLLTMCAALSSFGTSLMTGDDQGSGSTGNARVWNLGGGLTMTVRGFELLGDPAAFAAANTTHFGVTNRGLGVCGPAETCDFNQWQIDNVSPGGRDFVLFTFSSPVNLTSFTMAQTTITADSDWAWAISNAQLTTAAQLNGLTLHTVFEDSMSAGDTHVRPIGDAKGVQSILIGVGPTDSSCNATSLSNCDLFKLTDITVVRAPEPGSMALLGGGLLGLATLTRRRRRS
jgi:hypothetical protein